MEALVYLATLRSHRVAHDAPLVRAGAERALVRAAVVSDDRELRVEVEITPGKANRARLNGGAPTRPREILGALRAVLFAPEDLAIVRGDPSERRDFLDQLLVQRSPRLAGLISDYERVLKQRAALLKSAAIPGRRRGRARSSSRPVDGDETQARWRAVRPQHARCVGRAPGRARAPSCWPPASTPSTDLRPHVSAAYAQVAPHSAPLTSAVPELARRGRARDHRAGRPRRPGLLEAALLAELARVRPPRARTRRQPGRSAPRRPGLRLGELPVRGYASHGESWSAALALRLGSYEVLRSDHPAGGSPVLVLDDVFAELDGDRRDQLARVAGQGRTGVDHGGRARRCARGAHRCAI